MEINWIVGEANVGVERICPGIHITQSQWQAEWNEPFQPEQNDDLSDPVCSIPQFIWSFASVIIVNPAGATRTSIPIVDLVHATNRQSAVEIIMCDGFTGQLKKINEDVMARFSWWSPKFNDGTVESVRDRLIEDIMGLFGGDGNQLDQHHLEALRNQFPISNAFKIQEQYGDNSFTYTIEELCEFYARVMRLEVEQLRFKVLGTYLYKQEIMHAVCVCGGEDAEEMFNIYPDVSTPEDGDGAVVTRNADGNWEWKAQATATEMLQFNGVNVLKYRRWEHVAFAFYLPPEHHLLHVDDIERH
ncbi:Hypothetical predicted protein [Paramuricea clavata]|uniref:Uncharacterized protein n=1 Tax=Paramuricea clavata TaxID=317549 RepID=A0A7D9HYR4_PARCT|nr:Hypothetical predicted protein [Paramuricea clavata]